ncbi:MAG TPA: Crp/Fnr family transcriptional regulator [Candidatus Saccharimonadales bacterium]|nr:Crp/Fnr family transcriptional regulator [Candidatus Saccharimonadales bacterium]
MLANANELRALVNLFHTGTKLAYSKGEFIIRPGGTPPGVFYIEQGLVKAYDITKYGEENLLIIRKSGEMLGLTWAVTGEDRNIIYAALAPTTVWLVSREMLVAFIRENPSAAIPIIDMVTDMYRIHSERIMTLEYRTVRERLISFLVTTARRFGKRTAEGGLCITVPLKHQDIASSISATRETTSRALAELERKGLISTEQSCITLVNVESLRDFL